MFRGVLGWNEVSLILVSLIGCVSINSVVIAQTQQLQEDECTHQGLSPACDQELDHPIDQDKPFNIEDAVDLIQRGITTSQDLYQMGAITLDQKRQLEVRFSPNRL